MSREPTIAQRIEHRRLDEVHECIRPGCGRRAQTAYYVHAATRIAGRDMGVGDFVDLCPEHNLELTRAAQDAIALGFHGPFHRVAKLVEAEFEVDNPLDRFREWDMDS